MQMHVQAWPASFVWQFCQPYDPSPPWPCRALPPALPCSYSYSGCAAGVAGYRLGLGSGPRYTYYR